MTALKFFATTALLLSLIGCESGSSPQDSPQGAPALTPSTPATLDETERALMLALDGQPLTQIVAGVGQVAEQRIRLGHSGNVNDLGIALDAGLEIKCDLNCEIKIRGKQND